MSRPQMSGMIVYMNVTDAQTGAFTGRNLADSCAAYVITTFRRFECTSISFRSAHKLRPMHTSEFCMNIVRLRPFSELDDVIVRQRTRSDDKLVGQMTRLTVR